MNMNLGGRSINTNWSQIITHSPKIVQEKKIPPSEIIQEQKGDSSHGLSALSAIAALLAATTTLPACSSVPINPNSYKAGLSEYEINRYEDLLNKIYTWNWVTADANKLNWQREAVVKELGNQIKDPWKLAELLESYPDFTPFVPDKTLCWAANQIRMNLHPQQKKLVFFHSTQDDKGVATLIDNRFRDYNTKDFLVLIYPVDSQSDINQLRSTLANYGAQTYEGYITHGSSLSLSLEGKKLESHNPYNPSDELIKADSTNLEDIAKSTLPTQCSDDELHLVTELNNCGADNPYQDYSVLIPQDPLELNMADLLEIEKVRSALQLQSLIRRKHNKHQKIKLTLIANKKLVAFPNREFTKDGELKTVSNFSAIQIPVITYLSGGYGIPNPFPNSYRMNSNDNKDQDTLSIREIKLDERASSNVFRIRRRTFLANNEQRIMRLLEEHINEPLDSNAQEQLRELLQAEFRTLNYVFHDPQLLSELYNHITCFIYRLDKHPVFSLDAPKWKLEMVQQILESVKDKKLELSFKQVQDLGQITLDALKDNESYLNEDLSKLFFDYLIPQQGSSQELFSKNDYEKWNEIFDKAISKDIENCLENNRYESKILFKFEHGAYCKSVLRENPASLINQFIKISALSLKNKNHFKDILKIFLSSGLLYSQYDKDTIMMLLNTFYMSIKAKNDFVQIFNLLDTDSDSSTRFEFLNQLRQLRSDFIQDLILKQSNNMEPLKYQEAIANSLAFIPLNQKQANKLREALNLSELGNVTSFSNKHDSNDLKIALFSGYIRDILSSPKFSETKRLASFIDFYNTILANALSNKLWGNHTTTKKFEKSQENGIIITASNLTENPSLSFVPIVNILTELEKIPDPHLRNKYIKTTINLLSIKIDQLEMNIKNSSASELRIIEEQLTALTKALFSIYNAKEINKGSKRLIWKLLEHLIINSPTLIEKKEPQQLSLLREQLVPLAKATSISSNLNSAEKTTLAKTAFFDLGEILTTLSTNFNENNLSICLSHLEACMEIFQNSSQDASRASTLEEAFNTVLSLLTKNPSKDKEAFHQQFLYWKISTYPANKLSSNELTTR